MIGSNRMVRVLSGSLISVAVALSSVALSAGTVAATGAGSPGAVYVLTNTSSNNAVAVFNRAADGTLTAAGTVGTGGSGAGGGLGSQGALAFSEDHRWLFAVNAGSNEISAFSIQPSGLTLAGKAASAGVRPVSLTVHDHRLFVLNQGDAGNPGNISGFKIGDHGELWGVNGSTKPLSSNAVGSAIGAAQVSFSPNGDSLVVTEKGTSKIDVYGTNGGSVWGPNVFNSAGAVPFGFAFSQRGALIVSEAATNSVSSYRLHDGQLSTVTATAPTFQLAPCWVAVTDNGKYAYAADAHNGFITGYKVANDGSLSILNANGNTANPGGVPLDLAFSNNSQYLYALNGGSHSLNAFAVNGDGSLTTIVLTGISLPASAVSVAAR